MDDAPYAARQWVDWFNFRRVLEPLGDMPLATPPS
jgi:transposase InsO family protein